MTTEQRGFTVQTRVFYMQPEEERVYEPSRKELWGILGFWAVSMALGCGVVWVAYRMGMVVWRALWGN